MKIIDSGVCHELLAKEIQPKLSYKSDCDFVSWRTQLKDKFIELLGLDLVAQNDTALNIEIEYTKQKEGYTITRFTFESERGAVVPAYILIPDEKQEKYPVAITLQGHTTGFHNSIGESKRVNGKEIPFSVVDTYALQAVKNGFIALAIEMRGMGETKPTSASREWTGDDALFTAHTALMLGRTVLAERIWDVKKAIDCLSYFSKCDLDKVLITGHSGGGTTAFYAACYDERIKLSVPSCSFCEYRESVMDILHCICNYIPSGFHYFEMSDLSALIAPRSLHIIAGEKDDIFPIDGVKKGYERAKSIYTRGGYAENCNLTITPKAHYWCEDIVWNTVNEEKEKLGW